MCSTMLKIKYSKYGTWQIDIRDGLLLYKKAKEKIDHALAAEESLEIATPYEAEAAWLIARCMPDRVKTIEFCIVDDCTRELKTISKDDFWRMFSSPLREFEILRQDIESWESGVDDTCPLDVDHLGEDDD